MAETSASGFLNIEINGSNPSDPIEGAKVTITEHQSNRIVQILETDRQGQINAIELQTVQSSSEDPWRPYKKYDLSVQIPPVGNRAETSYTYTKIGLQIYADSVTNNTDELSYILQLEDALTQRNGFEIQLSENNTAEHAESMVYQPEASQLPDRINESVSGYMPMYIMPFVPAYIDIYLGKVNPYKDPININHKKIIQDTYKNYLKRVCAKEFGGMKNLAEQAIIANVLAVNSFALNRMYTEVYTDKGYKFNITNSTAFDQNYPPAQASNERVDRIIDQYFDKYIHKGEKVQPYFSQYCANAPCENNGMGQLLSNQYALQGKNYLEILKAFYGADIEILTANRVDTLPNSYPGVLQKGMTHRGVGTLKKYLNVIRKSYPSIPLLDSSDLFDETTEKAVIQFQKLFKKRLPAADGIVNEPTWRLISEKYFFLGGAH